MQPTVVLHVCGVEVTWIVAADAGRRVVTPFLSNSYVHVISGIGAWQTYVLQPQVNHRTANDDLDKQNASQRPSQTQTHCRKLEPKEKFRVVVMNNSLNIRVAGSML